LSRRISKNTILKRLTELAFGGCNDAAKLAFLDREDLSVVDSLDLRALVGIHTSGNGGVEVRLLARIKLIELLLAATEERPDAAAGTDGLMRAIERSADRLTGAEEAGGGDAP
jgi:hypothetical protein